MKKKIVLRISAVGIFGMSGCPKGTESNCGTGYRSCDGGGTYSAW